MQRQPLVFLGTYTSNNASAGIYVHRYDPATGALKPVGTAPKVDNPSFLALSGSGRFLYATIENTDGQIAAFSVDPESGAMRLINQQSSHGAHPCHVVIDPTGKWVLSANYSSGSLCVLPIRDDGSLGPASDIVQQKGTGPNRARQEGPHAHSMTFDPAGRFVFAADLGADRLFAYRFDPKRGKLSPTEHPATVLAPGAGPRHFAFHPTARFAYAINELDSTITAFAYDARQGVLAKLHTVSTIPAGYRGATTCADIHVHPSGRFVYGSNRGHDSIAMYAVDPRTGRLTSLGQEPIRGKTPRNFAIAPGGKFLLVGGQDSNNVVTFRIQPDRGRLVPAGKEVAVPAPVCVVFGKPS